MNRRRSQRVGHTLPHRWRPLSYIARISLHYSIWNNRSKSLYRAIEMLINRVPVDTQRIGDVLRGHPFTPPKHGDLFSQRRQLIQRFPHPSECLRVIVWFTLRRDDTRLSRRYTECSHFGASFGTSVIAGGVADGNVQIVPQSTCRIGAPRKTVFPQGDKDVVDNVGRVATVTGYGGGKCDEEIGVAAVERLEGGESESFIGIADRVDQELIGGNRFGRCRWNRVIR